MTEQSHTSSLSGRELSRARRRAMSSTGAGSSLAGSAQRSAATQQAAPVTEMGGTPLTGAALSRARRAMLAKGGKSAIGAAAPVATATPAPVQQAAVEHDKEEPCCDACAEENRTMPCESCDTTEVVSAAPADASSEALDSLCDIIETSGSTNASSSVRDYCRQRRSQLSQKGKLALTGTAGRQARKSIMRQSAGSSLTGRALAKMQREDRCQFGRGDTSACRPSGRVRETSAPSKVEVGTTLSGQEVTGTQVEQSGVITGIDSGSCRAITGTEYLGAEQFSKFCSSTPPAPAAKVALSETSHGQLMTGTSTSSGNEKVTGDEAGSCKSVTGSEYLGAEHFGAFCGSQGMNKAQDKVVTTRTGNDIRITGVDEARDNAMTGAESGSRQSITGTDYANFDLKKKASTAPAKVAVSHTSAGIAVSGGESSRVVGVTGDEQGSCGRVTGTEYVSSERFVSTCGTAPAGSVAKVGVNSSQAGMSITGNLVDRTENVTGNEPGACQKVTGSQYSEGRVALCGTRQDKVQQMHTSQGGSLTGTETSSSPKLTGDNRGGCSIVTGSEYVSQEYFQQSCSQTPAPSGRKTGMSQTWHNQSVSGVQTGHSQKVTGDEHGLCKTVTGSTYTGREQASEFCDASAVAHGEQRLAHHVTSVMPVSGIRPGADERFAGNAQRGVCQEISGTPYQGPEEAPCGVSPQAAQYQADFSVMSPAKAARQHGANNAVHSSVYATGGPITGVVNKAEGVISGTPEFRHQQLEPVVAVVAEPVAVQRAVTGEGSEAGTQITGDDWSRGGSVTGTEGMFSARRNQTQRGTAAVERSNIGAHALKDREPREVSVSRVTGSSGNSKAGAAVTLSGGAGA